MTATQPASGTTADRIGIPDTRINWTKNPLVTQIKFVDGAVREDSLKVRFGKSVTNPTDKDVNATGMPTPSSNPVQLYCEGKQIDPWPPTDDGVAAIKAPPRDDEIRKYRYVISARERYDGGTDYFVIRNSQLLPGTHIYEMVYWQSQLDWIDVREVLARTDAQGKGRMVYPITDNAPSNRLYFKVYKPTEEEAAKGHRIEFLGEVDARTQAPSFPRARPGDFSPRTGYWSAVGQTIDLIGGYHEVLVKEGDSMPNLPGKVGVDPFSFEWKYAGEHSRASGQQP
ncbi:hypothetical protein ACFQ3P_04480 [Paraburkholderia sabiae]|uniref:VgrG protein n=1 Tax=Paraburkholderia sabiae TaxID=273251 RepID=A0ABU9QMK3_9BURK|nr:hypothetical protein [Paraburkholderia sabiae]WJZ79121.1 hypothetical protein QEN71_34685 [Paraburkholderia sabiae]CAD6514349.1 hypothetical protein LMG24235_00897 [Paraburkholderia sabiae]